MADSQTPVSKAGPSPDQGFQDHVRTVQAAATNLGRAPVEGAQRRWSSLPEVSSWNGDPLDPEGMTRAFDRSAIDDKYVSVYSDAASPGVTGDPIALSLQASFIAARERARRLRCASSVRCAFHAAARRKGHGDEAGIYGNGIARYVQDILAQSATA